MSKIKWRYHNATDRTVIRHGERWGPDEEKEVSFPVPSSLGLTCLQEGNLPDPVLFHDDVIVAPGETKVVDLDGPSWTHQVALTLLCLSGGGGVECRFNSAENRPIPLDVRGFEHTMPWEMCARMFFTNPMETETHISVSAVEVTA